MNRAPTVALSALLALPFFLPPPFFSASAAAAAGGAASAKSEATKAEEEVRITAERSGCSVSLFFSRKPWLA